MKTIFIYLFYGLGQCFYWSLELATKIPHFPQRVFDLFYKPYSWCMFFSSDLDTEEKIWLRRRENETEEEFETRVRVKYPNSLKDRAN